MEKTFQPRYFVFICAMLVVVWGAYKIVGDMLVTDLAKQVGGRVFTWHWRQRGWDSRARMTEAWVVHKTDTEAIVKVRGRQVITRPASEPAKTVASTTGDCAASLTFYRKSNHWILGKVEFE